MGGFTSEPFLSRVKIKNLDLGLNDPWELKKERQKPFETLRRPSGLTLP